MRIPTGKRFECICRRGHHGHALGSRARLHGPQSECASKLQPGWWSGCERSNCGAAPTRRSVNPPYSSRKAWSTGRSSTTSSAMRPSSPSGQRGQRASRSSLAPAMAAAWQRQRRQLKSHRGAVYTQQCESDRITGCAARHRVCGAGGSTSWRVSGRLTRHVAAAALAMRCCWQFAARREFSGSTVCV